MAQQEQRDHGGVSLLVEAQADAHDFGAAAATLAAITDTRAKNSAQTAIAYARAKSGDVAGAKLFLGTLGNNAPFIGLLGTVLGIVTAFRELGNTQAGASSGMGNVMGGIAEALVATAIGILVALPAVIAYNVFQKKAVDVEDNAGALGNIVLASLSSHDTNGAALAKQGKRKDGGAATADEATRAEGRRAPVEA